MYECMCIVVCHHELPFQCIEPNGNENLYEIMKNEYKKRKKSIHVRWKKDCILCNTNVLSMYLVSAHCSYNNILNIYDYYTYHRRGSTQWKITIIKCTYVDIV